MNLAEIVTPNVPYLRRFSRALSGSQKSGDAYVQALLEALIADPSAVANAPSTRVALYRLLCRLWGSVSINNHNTEPGAAWERAAQGKLSHVAPRPRQAFLLTAVEGFSLSETGEILGTDEESVSSLISEASREIASMLATDVLIIEDEPLIAMDLQDIVTGLGHDVVAVARTRREAVEAAAASRPGIVLADIQLADGSSGIDAVNDLLEDLQVPVIFITAFPERLLTGARPEPAFLITKPFAPDMIKAMIGQALFFDRRARPARKAANS